MNDLLVYLARWDRRLRLTHTTLWVPRGLIIGVLIGIGIAVAARLRPLMLPSQVAAVVGVAILLSAAITLVIVWLAPRPMLRSARMFDSIFGLKERTSTAVELSQKAISAPDDFVQRQIKDTLAHAAKVVPSWHLPLQWRSRELVSLAILTVILGLAVFLSNPQSEAIAQQAAIDGTIQTQVENLERVQREIASNPNLTDEQRAELQQIVQDTIETLEQENVTQPEAVAALQEASQRMEESQQQLSPEQQQAAQNAANAMQNNQTTQGVGQQLAQNDLSGAASEMRELAAQVGGDQLTDQQREETADALEQAADAMQGLNPAAAEAMRRAAEALRRGDMEAAQQALQEAAEALQQQQDQMEQSDLSQAAQQAAQQMQQGSQQVAQAGQQGQQGEQSAQAQQNQQQNQQSGQQQSGQQSGQQQGQQSGQQSGQQQSDQQSGQQQGQQSGQQSGQQAGQEGDAQSGQQSGQQGGQQGQQSGQQSGQQGGQQSGQQQSGQGGQQSGSQSGNQAGITQGEGQSAGAAQSAGASEGAAEGAGQGSGGSGRDVTTGDPSSSNQTNPNNGRSDGSLANNQFVYAPTFIGGEGGQQINPDTDPNAQQTEFLEQGEFSENPGGEAYVNLNEVIPAAADQANQAMDADRVPSALRGLIRGYFTGLQQ
jgi:hypothetical protein